MGITVSLTNEEIDRVIDFCHKVQVSPKRFGQNNSSKREKERIYRDMLVGKSGEIAFQKYLSQAHQIDVPLDWEIYTKDMGDKQDVLLCHHRFEVKSIKSGGWLMIEKATLSRRKQERTLPHYLVLVKVPFDEKKQRPKNEATIMGYCSLDILAEEKHLLLEGTYLPNTTTTLIATNFGIHHSHLTQNWSVLLHQLKDIEYQFTSESSLLV